MLTCPKCESTEIHHSRMRSWFERARYKLTNRVPYRCHRCNWRGWGRDRAARRGDDAAKNSKELGSKEFDRLDPPA